MKIAVAGGTGRLGRHVSEVLAERGHEVVAMSRATGVDVITGAGLDAALNGAEVIIDAATSPSPEQQPATEFFVTAAHNLQQAGARAGVRRAVVVSIINIDKSAGGYGLTKIARVRSSSPSPTGTANPPSRGLTCCAARRPGSRLAARPGNGPGRSPASKALCGERRRPWKRCGAWKRSREGLAGVWGAEP